MKESSIVAACLKRLNKLEGVHARKVRGSAYSSGEPDLDIVAAGRSVKLEVKVPGEVATKLQDRVMAQWCKAGAVCAVVTSADAAVGIVEAVLEEQSSITTARDRGTR